jgi:two-component system NarL family sensor kinase
MAFPFRLVILGVLQVVLTAVLTYTFVTDEYKDLSHQSLQTLEQFLVEQKQRELENYTTLALSAVDHVYGDSTPENKANKKLAAQVFNRMLYGGEDGYFFVYDGNGTGVAHPKEPFRVGNNYWELESENGEKIIQILLKNAKKGGGFYRYPWYKPSSKDTLEKMSYSVYLEKWDWMLGTGVYLDDVYAQLNLLQDKLDAKINKTKQIILFVALSSILLIFLFGIAINLRHKKKADEKISELGQKIINLGEEERRHLSRELHDGIVQVLVAIKYSLEATRMHLGKNHSIVPRTLNDAESNLSEAIHEIRRISHHLHPRILDELGLSSALEALASEFSERTGIEVSIEKPAVRKLLPDNINTTLYRVVQESLTNIEKHAGACQVKIKLVIRQDMLVLSIADNGVGINSHKNKEDHDYGIGLRNLSERVEYLHGQFRVLSRPIGTTVEAKIPRESFANYFNQKMPEKP